MNINKLENKQRTASMELEIPMVLDDKGSPSTRKTTAEFFNAMHRLYGYEFNEDKITHEITGVTGAPYGIVELDAAVCTLEIAFAKTDDLNVLKKFFETAMGEIKSAGEGITFLSLSRQPNMADDGKTYKEYVTPKGIYPVILRRGWDHRVGITTAALQPCIGVSVSEAITAVNCLQAVSGIFIGLFANSPLFSGKAIGQMESRVLTWETFMAHSSIPYDLQMYGMWEKPFENWADYLRAIWNNVPVFFPDVIEKGESYKKAISLIPDENMTMLEFLRQGKPRKFRQFNGKDFDTIKLVSPSGFHVDKGFWWPFWSARIRAELDPAVDSLEIAKKVLAGDPSVEDIIARYQKNLYIEIRDVGTTREPLSAVAFALGLVENLEEFKNFIEEKPWDFWQDLRRRAIKEGMPPVASLIPRALEIAMKGLNMRGFGEEKFLISLLSQKESPAADVLRQFRNGGLAEVIQNNQF